MRFSYIDSQGKEIEVDSVESLALRIELGAIKPDTRMYDAVADRWAPAEEHPVYRSLSRGEEWDDEEWIAGTGEAGVDEPTGGTDSGETGDTPDEAAGDRGAAGDAAGVPPVEADPEDPLGLGFSVDMVGGEPSSGGGARDEASPGSASSGPEGVDPPDPADAPAGADHEDDGPDEAAAGFGGFGDLGGLELEEEEAPAKGQGEPHEPDGPEDATGEGGSVESERLETSPWEDEFGEPDRPEGASSEEPAPPADPLGGPPAGSAGAETADVEETTGSADPDAAPDWLGEGESLWEDEPRQAGASGGAGDGGTETEGQRDLLEDDPADPRNRMPEWAASPPAPDSGEAGGDESFEEVLDEGRDRPQAPRPAHWADRRQAPEQRSRAVRIAQVAAVVAILGGIGSYLVLGSGGSTTAGEAGAVEQPGLAPGLRAELVSAAELAYSGVLRDLREELPERDLPPAPPAAWLEGIYLSTASAYPGVGEYWRAVLDAVSTLQGRERSLYVRRLSTELTSRVEEPDGGQAGLSAGDVGTVLEEGRRQFRSTAPRRDSIYDGILGVATASIRLHEFLLEREEDIAYEPYSDPNVSRDPVLEAVPADSVLRLEMNERLDQVIDAILLTGVERPITTAGLFDHLFSALAEEGTVGPPAAPAGGEDPG